MLSRFENIIHAKNKKDWVLESRPGIGANIIDFTYIFAKIIDFVKEKYIYGWGDISIFCRKILDNTDIARTTNFKVSLHQVFPQTGTQEHWSTTYMFV